MAESRTLYLRQRVIYSRRIKPGNSPSSTVCVDLPIGTALTTDGETLDYYVRTDGSRNAQGDGYLVMTPAEDLVFLDAELLSEEPICRECEAPGDGLDDAGICSECRADLAGV